MMEMISTKLWKNIFPKMISYFCQQMRPDPNKRKKANIYVFGEQLSHFDLQNKVKETLSSEKQWQRNYYYGKNAWERS